MAKLLMVAAAALLISMAAALAGPLHDAVKDGDIEQVRLLIAQGEDVNQRHRTSGSPLHHAAVWANGDMA